MITIIFAKPRTGKTALMTHFLNLEAYNFERIDAMTDEIYMLNAQGFKLDIPPNPISANYDISFYKFGYSEQRNRKINPFRLGYPNEQVETHVDIPYGVYGIEEAQKYFNSRKSAQFPDWQSRWFEQHGHYNLDIYLDTQRPSLIDLNIRELAQFIEVIQMTVGYNRYGDISAIKWHIRRFESNSALEAYFASGKQDKKAYKDEYIMADYNVFDLYNTHSCHDRFFRGRENQNFEFDVNVYDDKPQVKKDD